jgi:hypothetical protein
MKKNIEVHMGLLKTKALYEEMMKSNKKYA